MQDLVRLEAIETLDGLAVYESDGLGEILRKGECQASANVLRLLGDSPMVPTSRQRCISPRSQASRQSLLRV